MKKEFDLVIRAGTLLCMSAENSEPLTNQAIFIQGSRIFKISPWKNGFEKKAKKFVDASNQLVMPGLINGHTHLPMHLFRGIADDLNFETWLHERIMPLERRLVSPDFVKLGTELAALETIKRGITTACDMFYFEDSVADVLDQAGLRAIAGESVLDYPTPDNPNKDGSEYKILDKMREKFKGHERIHAAIAPHAPYSCSDDTLKKAISYSEKYSIPIVIHVSETRKEVEDSLKQHGKSPVKRLFDLGLMKNPNIFAHCVHLSDEDMAFIKRSKTGVVHNLESNLKLAVGIAPIPRLRQMGIAVGVGSDSAASNNDMNLFREFDMIAKVHKQVSEDLKVLPAKECVQMGTSLGAEALGLGKVCGQIKENYFADIITLKNDAPEHWPTRNPYSQLVYSMSGSEVHNVLCHGKLLLKAGQIQSLDEEKIHKKLKSYLKKHNF